MFSGGLIRCPWHGACFAVNSGDIEDFPGLDSIPKFDVRFVMLPAITLSFICAMCHCLKVMFIDSVCHAMLNEHANCYVINDVIQWFCILCR